MINRDNWKLVKRYMAYADDVRQLSDLTLYSAKSQMHHLLEWADEVPFSKSPDIRPAFPRFMAARVEPASIEPACSHARQFFIWYRRSNPRLRSITDIWLETLTPARTINAVRQYQEYTLDDVRKIMELVPHEIRIQRDIAATAFLFLSGMRVGAFETMPIKSVDIEHLTVKQFPEWGVHTKNNKRATTFMLNIPDLLEMARVWDTLVHAQFGDDSIWYASIDPLQGTLTDGIHGRLPSRKFREGLQLLAHLAGIEYRTPHALRHGFAVYGLKAARSIADMEAVSKNLMHASLDVTLGVYAMLRESEVKDRITRL